MPVITPCLLLLGLKELRTVKRHWTCSLIRINTFSSQAESRSLNTAKSGTIYGKYMWNTFRTTSKHAVKYHDLQDGERHGFGAWNYDRLQWDVIADFVLPFGRMARSNRPREHFFPGIPSLTWWTFHHMVIFVWLNWADPASWHFCQISCNGFAHLTQNAIHFRVFVFPFVWLEGVCAWLLDSLVSHT